MLLLQWCKNPEFLNLNFDLWGLEPARLNVRFSLLRPVGTGDSPTILSWAVEMRTILDEAASSAAAVQARLVNLGIT